MHVPQNRRFIEAVMRESESSGLDNDVAIPKFPSNLQLDGAPIFRRSPRVRRRINTDTQRAE